jgi:hypothetical protein
VSFYSNLLQSLSRPVPSSPDFTRVNALPRRSLAPPPPEFGERWRLEAGCGDDACPYATGALNDFQRTFLWEVQQARGGVASASLGAGKTLAALLAPTVLGAERPVLFVPAKLRGQMERDIEHLSQHWVIVPPTLLAYSDLSNPKKKNILEMLDPDLITGDEVHTLASAVSVRGKRMRLFMKARPECMFVGMSATPTKRSIKDYAPLFYWALRQASPCPITYRALQSWSAALDDLGELDNAPPGVLSAWLTPEDPPGIDGVREAYRRRMADTKGVVFTRAMTCDAAVNVHSAKPTPPKEVLGALRSLRALWTLPDGTELSSGLEYHRALCTLAQGFWQRWTTPAPAPWLEARKAWTSEMRAYLGRRGGDVDSPGLYEKACKEGRVQSTAYQQWLELRPTFRPVTETVWLSDFAVQAAARWAAEKTGVVWSWSPSWGRRVAECAGVEYYGEGKDAERRLLDLSESRAAGAASLVASLQSHGEGRRLQAWNRMYFPYPAALSNTLEQAVGRQHRPGQRADEVEVYFALSTPEAAETLARAVRNARYAGTQFGSEQRLLRATYSFVLPAMSGPGLDIDEEVL